MDKSPDSPNDLPPSYSDATTASYPHGTSGVPAQSAGLNNPAYPPGTEGYPPHPLGTTPEGNNPYPEGMVGYPPQKSVVTPQDQALYPPGAYHIAAYPQTQAVDDRGFAVTPSSTTVVVHVDPDICVHCRIGHRTEHLRGLKIAMAVIFFPIGLLFCLLKDFRCSNCGRPMPR